ncbi:histidine phosphatase family protein [Streptomyces sp. NBC_01619]|uniref:Histidine phosphatase family protein n=1 Tax=Streptomyces pratisoli TaxID=3139917 RepID=A0ACC6QQ42_9ACTN|nr:MULTISPECIES: histidine phosphatase family protein [unclassified Streptomyces]MCX4514763.1 histidine phosphatase family protein [Streptomyces sp. NBC_01619]
MSIRLTLWCAAAGPAVREARFGDGPLDARGSGEARTAAAALPPFSACFRGPSVRCGQTAQALGLAATAEERLRDLDFGTWQGLTLSEVAAGHPEALAAWATDPGAAPHGGESVRTLCGRVGGWMDALGEDAGRVLAVVEPAVVRAAAVHALAAPLTAFGRVDVPPLSALTLTGRSGRWNLRLAAAASSG